MQDMSATEVIDYRKGRSELASFFKNNVGKFDCVFDKATNSRKEGETIGTSKLLC